MTGADLFSNAKDSGVRISNIGVTADQDTTPESVLAQASAVVDEIAADTLEVIELSD